MFPPKRQAGGHDRLAESLRRERVERLRKQIAEGTYHVPSHDVAEAMIRRGFTVTDRPEPRD